jgi:hypothetical protein
MGLAAFVCIFLGVVPGPLYAILPHPVDYVPYTAFHVIGMLELLMFGALAFAMLILSGYYPAEMRAVNLDTDWFARLPGRAFLRFCTGPLQKMGNAVGATVAAAATRLKRAAGDAAGVESILDRIFHGTAEALPAWMRRNLRPLNTENVQMAWNVAYVLIPFIGLLAAVLIVAD